MRHSFVVIASFVIAPFALYACSSSTSSPATAATAATDAGEDSAKAEGGSTPDAGQADTSTATIHCTQADFDKPAGAGGGDFTSFGGVDISFPTGTTPMQYSNHCAKVKVGSNVTFAGSFANHPLGPSAGSPANTPIPSQAGDADGGTLSFDVPNAGTFGFECQFHPTIMFGAIQVVP
jgi:plastocyanin